MGTDHGYRYGYRSETMGTGTRSWVRVRVLNSDKALRYGYSYIEVQDRGYGTICKDTVGMGPGYGCRYWPGFKVTDARLGFGYRYVTLYPGSRLVPILVLQGNSSAKIYHIVSKPVRICEYKSKCISISVDIKSPKSEKY